MKVESDIMKSNNKAKILENLALVSQLGISMLVPILIGMFLGKFLDDIIGTEFIFLGILTVCGVAAAFISLYKIATRGINRK